jgi:hypothetical protein
VSPYAALAIGILLTASHWYAYDSGGDNREAHVQNKYLKDYTENLQAARDEDARLRQQLKDAQDGHVQRENRLLADARNARGVSSGLRDELNAFQRSLPTLTDQAVRRYSAALGIVFNECQEKYGTLAEDAGRSWNSATTLDEAWPK